MYTRREFGQLTLAAFALPLVDPRVNGVRLGAQTYSFRQLPRPPGGDAIDPVIKACVECGIGEVELFAPQVEPQFNAGARGRRGDPPSPQAVKARVAEIITASTTLDVAKRIAPLAEKHRMVVAMHGHSNTSDPNEFATPD